MTLETLLMALLVLNALAMAGLILLQQGRGADVGAAFGSGAANTVFGSQGTASFLTKLTAWLAISFFAITFGLAYIAKEKAQSVADVGLPAAPVTAEKSEVPALDAGKSGSGAAPGAAVKEAPASGATAPPVDSDVPPVDD